MITDIKKWQYLHVSALLRGITSKNNAGYYCLNYRHSFRKENKLKLLENICKNYDYC